MLTRSLQRITYANVMATVAVFISLGGGAYALTVPRNSVGTKQLKSNAVTSSKVRNGSLSLGDFAKGSLPVVANSATPGPKGDVGARGLQGPAGPRGLEGPAGADGADGTAVAFAYVAADGTFEAANARGVTGVTSPQTGVYCFDLEHSVKNAVASIDGAPASVGYSELIYPVLPITQLGELSIHLGVQDGGLGCDFAHGDAAVIIRDLEPGVGLEADPFWINFN